MPRGVGLLKRKRGGIEPENASLPPWALQVRPHFLLLKAGARGPITTSNPEFQKWFDQGHTLLHGFWLFEAERSLCWALKLDPECAMAYWGLARATEMSPKRAKTFVPDRAPDHTQSDFRLHLAQDCCGSLPDAIYVMVPRGKTCRGVEIRDNRIRVARVKVPEASGGYTPSEEGSTMVGVLISLMNNVQLSPAMEADTEGVLENVLVQGNRIVGNTFEDIAAIAVVVEGTSNQVALRGADDTVRDLGTGNRVTQQPERE
jgi:hypothetical protein